MTRCCRAATASGLSAASLDRLAAWLPQGRVDRKRADAEAMLAAIRCPSRRRRRRRCASRTAWPKLPPWRAACEDQGETTDRDCRIRL